MAETEPEQDWQKPESLNLSHTRGASHYYRITQTAYKRREQVKHPVNEEEQRENKRSSPGSSSLLPSNVLLHANMQPSTFKGQQDLKYLREYFTQITTFLELVNA